LVYSADRNRFDWHTVALAARAFPSWRITLYNARTLVAYQPALGSPTIRESAEAATVDADAVGGTDAAAVRDDHADVFQERMAVATERWVLFATQRGIDPLAPRIEDLHVAARQLHDRGGSERDVLDLIEQVGSMARLLFTDEWTQLRQAHAATCRPDGG
jgi:hypothetical protein